MNLKQHKIRFWELLVALIISFFFATFNNASIAELIKHSTYFRDILLGTIITFILLDLIRVCTNHLDDRLSWISAFNVRLIKQVIYAILLPILIVYTWNFSLYHFFIPDHVFGTPSFLSVEFPVSILLILIFNLFFIGNSLFQKRMSDLDENVKEVKQQLQNEQKQNDATILLEKGNKKITTSVSEIAVILLSNGVTKVKTFKGETLFTSLSLNQLSEQLPDRYFFRVNRQHILNLKACKSYKTVAYGKIEIKSSEHEDAIIVSQKTAPAFRKWIKHS